MTPGAVGDPGSCPASTRPGQTLALQVERRRSGGPAGTPTPRFPVPCRHRPEPSVAATPGSRGGRWHQIKAKLSISCIASSALLSRRSEFLLQSNDSSELSAASSAFVTPPLPPGAA